ncbi:MAG: vanadium-dependent haloperoxidase [Methyloglobulus sp.]|nr:vanadium-dependent haloperoxidase [Methyloglobulus sp.]
MKIEPFNFKIILSLSVSAVLAVSYSGSVAAGTVVTQWNDAALEAIRATRTAPPVVARALAITHTCMYDAWAAYDGKAKGTQLGDKLRRPSAERTDANKEMAISYAAHECLSDLFPTEAARFGALMTKLGFDPSASTADSTKPAGVGNAAGKAVLDYRHHDGSNQLGDLNPGAYTDYTGYAPKNTPTSIIDPNLWQPLQVGANVQKFVTPHWGKVIPYAMKTGNQYRKTLLTPADYVKSPVRFEHQAKQVLEYTANLTDEKKAIAEYWADGPASETPPGHWALFAEYVSERDRHTVDQDVKMFFAMTNAVFDASIAAWDAKRAFDCVRPITAIHYLYAGQSVKSWQGNVDGADWKPYQVDTLVTPAFAEYVSGHSIFSASAAETLNLFTGSDYFGQSATVAAGSSRVEPGLVPANDTVLYWASFSEAADEAGISRRYGGIHFIDGDLEARKLGRLIAQQAWKKTQRLMGTYDSKHEKDDKDDEGDDKEDKD